MRRLLPLIFLLLVAACSDSTPSAGPLTPAAVPAGDDAVVVHVSDGDSLIVEIDGTEYRVRLIGINAPERDECFGPEAQRRLETLVLDQHVTLVDDIEPEDQYGRLLRYVYLDTSLLNAALVADGFAMSRSYEPNTAAQTTLDLAEETARQAHLGMWAEEACVVSSGIGIESIQYDAAGPDDENLNGEWVTMVNNGDSEQSLSGWSIRDAESVNRYSFPDTARIDAGQHLRIYTGCGEDDETSLFWCAVGPVWNNRGDVGFLLDPSGKIASRFEY